MTDPVTFTVNLKLAKVPANGFNWTALMNNNLMAVDAAISQFFIIQQYTGPWTNSTPYVAGDTVLDTVGGGLWQAGVPHNSAVAPTTFAQDRAAHPTYWAAYSNAGVGRGVWAPQTAYRAGNFVVSGNQYAVCIVTHVSGNNFTDDVGLGKWAVLIDFSLVSAQPWPILGGLLDANKFGVSNSTGTGWTTVSAQQARALLGALTVGEEVFLAGSTSAALQALGISVVGQGIFTAVDEDAAQVAMGAGAFGKLLFETPNVTAAQSLLGFTPGNVYIGSILWDASGSVTPDPGYLMADGSAVSRTTYLPLFGVIGTQYGPGDGINTFNLPNVPAFVVYAVDGTPITMRAQIRAA